MQSMDETTTIAAEPSAGPADGVLGTEESAESAQPENGGGRKRILVVNDTQEILELFQDLLVDLGYEPVLMSFAPNELEQIKRVKPDLIIVDFILGNREMDGWQLLQKLRMERSTQHIPIIACTAAVHAVREQEGYLTDQGIVIVLKPFSIDQLRVALEKSFSLQGHSLGISPEESVDEAAAAG